MSKNAPTEAQRREAVEEAQYEIWTQWPVNWSAIWVGALAAMRDRPSSEALLPTLADLPTLVIVGEGDVITPPEHARALAQAIPGARLAIIPGAGHLPPVEQPEATTRSLREFLESIR